MGSLRGVRTGTTVLLNSLNMSNSFLTISGRISDKSFVSKGSSDILNSQTFLLRPSIGVRRFTSDTGCALYDLDPKKTIK
jgi:hypothetical protein